MTLRKILVWPDPSLTTPAKEVKEFDSKLVTLARDMHETMIESGGVGLAANQIGELQRIITIAIPWLKKNDSNGDDVKKWWHNQSFTFVNPKIVSKKGEIKWQEGCLSFPEMFEYVNRASEIVVQAKDEFGKDFEVQAEELFAVCLQHEIDHLDGIVFVERMSRIKSQLIKKKMLQRGLAKLETSKV